MKDLEILKNIDLNKILSELYARDKKISTLSHENVTSKGKYVDAVNAKNSREVQELREKLDRERELKLQAYDRLEGLRVEMRALEGKDLKSDLWKEKCRELFDMCSDLQKENDELKGVISDATRANMLPPNDGSDYPTGLSNNVMSVRSQQFRNERSLGNRTLGNLAVSKERMFKDRLGSGSEAM